MMTNGPAAGIGDILEIDLPRPRDRVELSGNEKYNHYRHEVLQFLYERQRRPGEDEAAAEQDEESSPTFSVVKLEAA
jgi:nitrate/nitrite transport system ATP-binding protein